jgi:hypothetical protein
MTDRKMDKKAQHCRKQAAKLRKIADSTSDDTTRRNFLSNIAAFEQMAFALDSIAPADRVHPKHPGI